VSAVSVKESENLRLARQGYADWNRGDLEAILADTPEDFEIKLSGGIPDLTAAGRGPEGLREVFTSWYSEPWEGNLTMDIEDLIEVDENRILALLVIRGTGKGSGVPVALHYSHLLTFRRGVNTRVEGFAGWRAGLAAAGLRE
jgi:ketosteroid isomerase-like protein